MASPASSAAEGSAARPSPAARLERPDYGLDAPGVVRNLFLAGAAGLVLWLGSALRVWPGAPWGVPLTWMGFGCFVGFTATGIYMVWLSKVGKVRFRERLLDKLPWRGEEMVLDVGCGRGLMLIAAARRLAPGGAGKACGIDIWQAEDLTGNAQAATLENARREGVLDRVEIKTADMRQIPYADGTFDAVVSTAAIHSLYDRADRAKAIAEIARVLKPGGGALISDIRHLGEYAQTFRSHKFTDIRRVGSPLVQRFWAVITFGSFQPATLLARKRG